MANPPPFTAGAMTRAELLDALDWRAGTTVLAPADHAAGSWVGAPSAVLHRGVIYLAYRLRRAVGAGRGYANVIATTIDGVELETIAVIERDKFDADSLERPCLLRLDDGRWRVYISCATPESKHWRVDVLEAPTIQELPAARPLTVLPGDRSVAVKDPVILRDSTGWHLWASCHPLDDPAATDRMRTAYAKSSDGLRWSWQHTALRGRVGTWDQRGVRFASVLRMSDGYLAFYDGRATAAQNWQERTGAACAYSVDGRWQHIDDWTFASPLGSGGLRYLCAVENPAGGLRVFYESACPGGIHELRTQLIG